MMQHKGYTGKVEFDDEAEIFHGEVIGLRDVITFQGRELSGFNKVVKNRASRRDPALCGFWKCSPIAE